LQAAPSRLFTIGVPVAAVLIVAVVFSTRWNRGNPFVWGWEKTQQAAGAVAQLGENLQPNFTVEVVPPTPDPATLLSAEPVAGAASNAAPSPAAPTEVAVIAPPVADTPAVAPATATVEMPTPLPTATATSEPTAPATNTPEVATATSVPAATRVATPVATQTAVVANAVITASTVATGTGGAVNTGTGGLAPATPTRTLLSVTATATPAAAGGGLLPTPTPTGDDGADAGARQAAAAQISYEVESGDTLFDIAEAFDVSVPAILAANGLTENAAAEIRPGDELIIPVDDTVLAAAENGIRYTVRAGDTPSTIAERFDVTTEALLRANGLTLADATALGVGDTLLIPLVATATPVATPTAQPTSTLPPATATPAPTLAPTAAVLRLDAPVLRSPEGASAVRCDAPEPLVWNPVGFIAADEFYRVNLGYVSGVTADGSETVMWVIAQQRPSDATQWQLDGIYCNLAPQEYGRQWRWFVDVVAKDADGAVTPVSPPSEVRGFVWQ
jgi:LysM repeat protein